MSKPWVLTGKINSFILNFFGIHQVVCQSKHELLNLFSEIINAYFFIHSGQPITLVAIADKIVMPAFCKYIKNKRKRKNKN